MSVGWGTILTLTANHGCCKKCWYNLPSYFIERHWIVLEIMTAGGICADKKFIQCGSVSCYLAQPFVIKMHLSELTYSFTSFKTAQIAKFMGPKWGPPGTWRPQIGPMLAPWTLLSGTIVVRQINDFCSFRFKRTLPVLQINLPIADVFNIFTTSKTTWYITS